MNIIDFKDSSLNLDNCLNRYEEVDARLLKCNSLTEQKELLIEKYEGTYRRDELIFRKNQLKNLIEFDSKYKIVQFWDIFKTIIIGIITALFTVTTDNIVSSVSSSEVTLKIILLSIIDAFLIVIIYFIFRHEIKGINKEFHKKEIPVYEINKIESKMIEQLLTSNKSEFSREEIKEMII